MPGETGDSVEKGGGVMELDEAIQGRRSIRKYTDEKVSDDKIRDIIQAGVWAPSACNLQQWKFIVIDDTAIFEKLYKMGAASFVKKSKQAILVLYNNQTDNVEYQDYIQSSAAAIENMLLKAYSLKIGTCWVNNLPNKSALRRLLKIPRCYDPIALITLGYYMQEINARPRKYNLEDQIAYNGCVFNQMEEKSSGKVFLKRNARRIYKHMPFKPFLLKFVGKMEKKFDN